MLSPSRFTYSVFVCISILLYLTTYYTWCCIYVNLLSPWVTSCWQWAATLRGFRTSLSLITWYRWSPSVLGEWLLMCLCLITMIVHVVTERFIANSFQPFIYNVLSDGCCLHNPLTAFLRAVWFFLCVYRKNMHFFIAMSILFWGLFVHSSLKLLPIKFQSSIR